MGGGSYSSETRAFYSNTVASKSTDEVFKQNVLRKIHQGMDPMNLGIRESRDSENHPESIAVIIALDVTGSMGHIPERIVKNDLTTIMETLINAGLKDIQLMFMAIGDHHSDNAPLQVGQFESADKELAMWLENTWLEGNGGHYGQESYGLAWLVGGYHTAIDCLEKRNQKGFLFTIGDEGFHNNYNVSPIVGAGQSYSAQQLLDAAREKYHVFHIHAAYSGGNSPNIQEPWKDLLGQHLLTANTDAEIPLRIVETISASLNLNKASQSPVIDDEEDGPAPSTDEPTDKSIML